MAAFKSPKVAAKIGRLAATATNTTATTTAVGATESTVNSRQGSVDGAMQKCGLCSLLSRLLRRAMCVGSRRGSGESYYQELAETNVSFVYEFVLKKKKKNTRQTLKFNFFLYIFMEKLSDTRIYLKKNSSSCCI